jgi:hypothetical protein
LKSTAGSRSGSAWFPFDFVLRFVFDFIVVLLILVLF